MTVLYRCLELLLERWKENRPEVVYLIGYTRYSDRHRDKMITLYHQFCLGFQQLGGEPILIGQRSFKAFNKKVLNVNNVNIFENRKLDIKLEDYPADHPWSRVKILHAQENDTEIAALKACLKKERYDPKHLPAWHIDQFSIINDLIYHDSTIQKKTYHQLVIPPNLQQEALAFVHTQIGVHAGTIPP